MCQVHSGGDTNHTAHYSWSLIETSCKSTIKQEVSTLPGTSINRSMTWKKMRTWGCKLRSNKFHTVFIYFATWYVASMQKIKTRKSRSMSKSFRHFSGTREAPRGEQDCTTNTMNRDWDTTSGCNWQLARTSTALQIFETTSYIIYSQWACESVC